MSNYVICISNESNPASLILVKVYAAYWHVIILVGDYPGRLR